MPYYLALIYCLLSQLQQLILHQWAEQGAHRPLQGSEGFPEGPAAPHHGDYSDMFCTLRSTQHVWNMITSSIFVTHIKTYTPERLLQLLAYTLKKVMKLFKLLNLGAFKQLLSLSCSTRAGYQIGSFFFHWPEGIALNLTVITGSLQANIRSIGSCHTM